MTDRPTILWLRQDLRLGDHPALVAAARSGPVLPVYVLDTTTPGRWRMGGASRWWLHMSLTALAQDLEAHGTRLLLLCGVAEEVIAGLAEQVGATAVRCTRAYEPWAAAEEAALARRLEAKSIAFARHRGALLFEPESLRTQTGGTFRVFTPFSRAAFAAEPPPKPVPVPREIRPPARMPRGERLADWSLLPSKPDWAGGLRAAWVPGEAAARRRLRAFVDGGLGSYDRDRDRPGIDGTSRLSPHLHFGEISPHVCWHAAVAAAGSAGGKDKGTHAFLRELLWREFSTHLLAEVPSLPEVAFRPEFEAFPWAPVAGGLAAWRRGRTGYPIVDAGMRELWATGYMHNRVRLITASFLIKHLLTPWQDGEAWFWDTLVDADLANNAGNWQWVAGSGADAAPYFRIFNPMLQGAKFDPAGTYVRRWVPELAKMPDAHIHAPFEAPRAVLEAAGIALGRDYPHPIVGHAEARARALAAFEGLRRH